jgi:hypothetical protein
MLQASGLFAYCFREGDQAGCYGSLLASIVLMTQGRRKLENRFMRVV